MGVEYIMMIGSGTVCSYTLFSTLCHACAKLSSSAASNVASQLSSSFPLTEVCRAAWRMSLLILSAFYLVLYLDLVLPELTSLLGGVPQSCDLPHPSRLCCCYASTTVHIIQSYIYRIKLKHSLPAKKPPLYDVLLVVRLW